MDVFVPRRPNQPTDMTPRKEVPNGVTTWDFNDLGARAPCSCSRYRGAAPKLFDISLIFMCTVSEACAGRSDKAHGFSFKFNSMHYIVFKT